MGIGASIVLIAVGLILGFAVGDVRVLGVDLNTVGYILALCGVLGLVITMLIFAPRRNKPPAPAPQQSYYRDDRGSY